MAKKPFDPTLKQLAEQNAPDWLGYFAGLYGLLPGRAEVIDSDISTVSAASDKVIRAGGRKPWILHLEFVSSHTVRLGKQTLRYNVLLSDQHNLPVHSVVVLLRPQASRASVTGVVRLEGADGETYLEFRYYVIRLWELATETLLTAGLGLLPLAPLTNVTQENLPAVIRRMEERLAAEATEEKSKELWTTTYLLLGLNYSEPFIASLLKGVRDMKESSTYQAILAEGEAKGVAKGRAEGRADEARDILLRLGRPRLGEPDSATQALLVGISDLNRLEELIGRVIEAESWSALLPPRTKRKKRSS